MPKKRFAVLAALALVLAFGAVACGGSDEASDDLLAQIEEAGVITVSTDPAYPPQSSLNQETREYEGFDIDVAKEIAERLGVDIAWQEPSWEAITGGNWAGRWDISVGSMTITPERSEVLHFTPPYYYTPASIAVHRDNTTINGVDDLDGKRIGVCGACTYDTYLQGTLEIAQDPSGDAVAVESPIQNPSIQTKETDIVAIDDLALGDGLRLDAVISALPTLQEAINSGKAIKVVGEPVYYEPLSVALDRNSQLDPQSLLDRIGDIIEEMHEDGTLAELSEKWYGYDLTQGPES